MIIYFTGRNGVALEEILCKMLEEQLNKNKKDDVPATPSSLVNPKVFHNFNYIFQMEDL